MNGIPRYAVVLLTWNSRRHIPGCIDSLVANAAPGTQLIVVDNGSTDGTPDEVLARAPHAEMIYNQANLGVAVGRNQGLAAVRAPYGILLDVDTIVLPGALDRLVEHLNGEPRVGLCGPRLLLPDGSTQASCQLFPTVRDKVLRQLPPRIGRPLLQEVELAAWDHTGVRDVDFVVGACQAIRMAALGDVGPLDERIFYGPEDVDLCLRMQLQGYRVSYVGDSVIRHECQRVTRHRFDHLAWRHFTGLLHYYRTHRYLWSREGLYRRIAAAASRRDGGLPGQDGSDGSVG